MHLGSCLQGNKISNLDDVTCLAQLPCLRTVHFQTISDGAVDPDETNPICNHPAYRPTVRRMLPSLKCLDGEWFDLVDALGDGDGDEGFALPEVKPAPWFNADDMQASLDAEPASIKGMEEFEQALTDCKRIGARAQELIDDFKELKLP